VVDSADLSRLRIAREPRDAAFPMRRLLRFVLPVLVVLLVLSGILAITLRSRGVEVATASAVVRGGSAGGGGFTANGYVVARTKASVSSKVPGRLASLAYEEGDQVPAGAIIAMLEAAEYHAAVGLAEAELLAADAAQHEAGAALMQAQRGLARVRTLTSDSLLSAQALEDAETAVEVTQARVHAASARRQAAQHTLTIARANLENTRVRAPFAGTVLRKDAEVGEVVAPSVGGGFTRGAVVTMADMSTLEVEVDINEAYIGDITREQPADITLDAYPREQFPGRVRQVVPTADRQKATVLVRVAIDVADPRILPEMGARVVFRSAGDGETEPARVFVPAAAVRSAGAESVVYIIVDGRARRRVVETGPVTGAEREVRQGLNGGELLVLDPPAGLDDGARVRVAKDT
jgi:RND family efflux transporter MFP subunit